MKLLIKSINKIDSFHQNKYPTVPAVDRGRAAGPGGLESPPASACWAFPVTATACRALPGEPRPSESRAWTRDPDTLRAAAAMARRPGASRARA